MIPYSHPVSVLPNLLPSELTKVGHQLHVCIREICLIVSQATPFVERGRVWSHCDYQVVVMAETWCDQ